MVADDRAAERKWLPATTRGLRSEGQERAAAAVKTIAEKDGR